ncbi:MAG: hypothetical protein NW226_14345 [Microscillaceae bacterium]|nr:hypothetical protein [Microscillaceae bacterium]
MANENLVSVQITSEDLKKVTEALKIVEDTLKPYLIALTPEERKKKLKMGDKTIPFVEKVSEYVKSNPEFVPAFMNVQQLEIDFKAVSELTLVLRPSEQVTNGLKDTILQSGGEAYSQALMYYNSVKQAAKNNILSAKTIFEDLKKRFEKIKSKNSANNTKELNNTQS